MNDDETTARSEVEIHLGENRIQIGGSEEFVSKELSDILEWVSEHQGTLARDTSTTDSATTSDEAEPATPPDQSTFTETINEGTEDPEVDAEEGIEETDPLEKVADSINVDADKLREKFYIDSDGVGIQDPRSIKPKYALLGYGVIKQELDGVTYLDNTETKKKLIDQERVNIDRWGANFLHHLRRNGLIKDDPNTDRKRNKPFKITPKGFEEFVEWIENGGEE